MVSAVITDIEGTTSSISFVKDVLFPYAARHMLSFLRDNWDDDAVQQQIRALAEQSGQPVDTPEAADGVLQQWISEDRKATPLKTLQGMLWKAGYERGEYRAHVYDDAAQVLQQWADAGLALYVYSSGSISAQKLFFAHSDHGNLLPLFQGHFDTTIGAKQDPQAYRNIARTLAMAPGSLLFLSDVPAELDAARSVGLQTVLLARPADACVDPDTYQGPHALARDFRDIQLTAG